jgi:hypothetical protein
MSMNRMNMMNMMNCDEHEQDEHAEQDEQAKRFPYIYEMSRLYLHICNVCGGRRHETPYIIYSVFVSPKSGRCLHIWCITQEIAAVPRCLCCSGSYFTNGHMFITCGRPQNAILSLVFASKISLLCRHNKHHAVGALRTRWTQTCTCSNSQQPLLQLPPN